MTILVVGPDVPDDAPAIVKEGLTRRRLVSATGVCPPPCGAVLPCLNREQRRRMRRDGGVLHLIAHHDNACPAIAPQTIAWLAGGAR